jgi:biotin carboxylase
VSILILNFSPHERTPYEELFANVDEPLVLITSDTTAPAYPKDAYEHIEIIEDYMLHPLVYHRAVQLHKKYSFRKVVSAFEADIFMAAKLREYFNIEGQSVSSATHYRDKVIMKNKVSASGLRVPKYRLVNDVLDLHAFIEQNGYPILIKPVEGFGSIGTTIIHNEEEFEVFLKYKPDLQGLEVEEFIHGSLHTVDGIVQDSEVVFICVSEAVGGNFIDLDHKGISGSSQLHPQNPLAKRLVSYCKKLIKALDTPKHTAFHAEIFHTHEDDIVLCEIASRPSGAHIAPAVQNTYDVDMTQIHVQLQAGVPISLPNDGENYSPEKLTAWVYFNLKEGILNSLPTGNPPKGVYEYIVFGEVGQTFSKKSYALGRLAHMMIEGRSEQELKERVQEACTWFTSQVTWK